RFEADRNAAELVAGRVRRIEVADCDQDVDVSRQRPRALERRLQRADETPDRSGRDPRASLPEPQQREPGMRLAAVAARVAVRVLGRAIAPRRRWISAIS